MVEGNIEPWLMTYQVTKKYFILQNTKILRSDRAWCLMNMWNSIKYGFDVSNDGLCLCSSRSKGGMALVLGITKIINVLDCECDDSVDKTHNKNIHWLVYAWCGYIKVWTHTENLESMREA